MRGMENRHNMHFGQSAKQARARKQTTAAPAILPTQTVLTTATAPLAHASTGTE